jgi:hypothetical protein
VGNIIDLLEVEKFVEKQDLELILMDIDTQKLLLVEQNLLLLLSVDEQRPK